MTIIGITAGPFSFKARMEPAAPQTCRWFQNRLPFGSRIIHVRWSGEAVWIPFGNEKTGLGFENHTSHPAKGEILLYPGGLSEVEMLLAYGGVAFASKVGPLAGNHFLTIVDGLENLPELGRLVLWEGAQEIRFASVS